MVVFPEVEAREASVELEAQAGGGEEEQLLQAYLGGDSVHGLEHLVVERLDGHVSGGSVPAYAVHAGLLDSRQRVPRMLDLQQQAGPAFDNLLAGSMQRIKEDKPVDDVNSLISEFVPESAPAPEAEPDLGPIEDLSDEGLYQKALEYIRQTGRFSTSALQRRLKIGYNKAGRITDMLEERGIIGPGGKAGGSREILVDLNAMAREQLAGTDGEAAAFDTRTDPPAEAPAASAPEEDFDLGDFDPDSLDMPDVIHPATQEESHGTR